MATTTRRFTKGDRERSTAALAELLTPGQTIYTCLRSVSSSGMSRRITVHIIEDGHLRDITLKVAAATGFTLVETPAYWQLRVGGAGMDMGFHVVYTLGRTLYPAPASDPYNSQGDGGYAFRQEWV